jgi:hypothetical protein
MSPFSQRAVVETDRLSRVASAVARPSAFAAMFRASSADRRRAVKIAWSGLLSFGSPPNRVRPLRRHASKARERSEFPEELDSSMSEFHASVCVPRKRLRNTPQIRQEVFLT